MKTFNISIIRIIIDGTKLRYIELKIINYYYGINEIEVVYKECIRGHDTFKSQKSNNFYNN